MNSKNLFNLNGKIAVITGGLGQLGRQYTYILAENGAKVAIIDIKAQCSDENINHLVRNDSAMILACDITNRKDLEDALERIQAKWGDPSILVNNAALDSPPNSPSEENGPFETYPELSWDKVISVNLKGTFLPCQVFGGNMASKVIKGSIINISSIYGNVSPDQSIYEYRMKKGKPFFKPVAYSVTKSGILNLTRYLATYWGNKGIRVNTLTLAGVFNNQDSEFLKNYLPKVPLKRMANEDEYNGAILFLASDASSYMTGSNMIIDGGWMAW